MFALRVRGAALAFLFGAVCVVPALGQEVDETARRIAAVEEKLRLLQQQADELQHELQSLKSATAPEAAQGVPPTVEPAEPEDLTAIEPVERTAEASPSPEPGVLDAQIIESQPAAPARNIFNPDISVIGNFLGHAGDENPLDERDSLAFDEAELSLQAFVDPYAKAFFFLGFGEEGAEVEEGYAAFQNLPWDLTAKAGKMKVNFGKFNLQHGHTWMQVDQPLVNRAFFGDEGMADSGISLSKLFPNRWNLFVEATGEVLRGRVEDVFDGEENSDLLYVGHLKLYRDLTENGNLELGGSYATGPIGEAGRSDFAGLDLTYRWRPLNRAIYRSFISRTELILNDRDDRSDDAFGFYTAGDYQFSRRWLAGFRLDRVERPDDPSLTDRGGALTLTFRPSEFSQIRGQYRRIEYDQGPEASEFLFQIQFAIGPHGAHTF